MPNWVVDLVHTLLFSIQLLKHIPRTHQSIGRGRKTTVGDHLRDHLDNLRARRATIQGSPDMNTQFRQGSALAI